VVARAVVAAFTRGLAVLLALAAATQLGWLPHPAGLLAWLRTARLPNLATGGGTGASQDRSAFPPAGGRSEWRPDDIARLTSTAARMCTRAAVLLVLVGYCLAKNTSGSLRPCGYMKLCTVSRLSPQAK
jgi:hypothetical protein